jgi:hypothetical protein
MQKGTKGLVGRVPDKYLSYKKERSDVKTTVLEIRPQTSSTMNIDGSQNNMLQFYLPNNPGMFLLCDTIFLSGNVQATIASTSGSDTYALLKPGITNLLSILQRHEFKVGSQLVDECRSSNLNCLHWQCKTNSLEDLQNVPYGQCSYITGATAAAYRAFRIPLQNHDSELFGVGRVMKDFSKDDVHAIPLWLVAKNELNIWFDYPANVVSMDPTYSQVGTLTPSYQLQNLHLETYWMESPSLWSQVTSQGWSATFRSSLYFTANIQPQLSGTTLSIQIPSSFNSVSHIMGIIQRPADLTDLKQPNRKFQGSSELGIPTSTQVRINSIQVYQEPLGNNGSDLQRELNKLHPESRTSSAIMSASYAAVNGASNSTNLIYGLKIGADYVGDSGGLLSGAPTSNWVGAIVVELQFSSAITTASVLNSWLMYDRYFSIAPNGAIMVKY